MHYTAINIHLNGSMHGSVSIHGVCANTDYSTNAYNLVAMVHLRPHAHAHARL